MMTEAYDRIGPYELRGELGRGAMARVWRAWDPKLQREVAIKEPLFDPRLSQAIIDEMGRRFVAEGRTAARLNHPGIVTIYAADVYDGRPAIVMELIDGETLSARLSRGPLAPAEALSVLDQLLDAVGYAHQHGVVHRDIKPDNVFVTANGRVKLADFGIAHADGGLSTMGTVAGAVLGTPGYMSPEQATGSPVDGRSDLFSVGTMAYEMLTGSNPFGAGAGTDATTLIYRIVHEPAPELPATASAGLPYDLRPAIMAALSKNPLDRPQTADEFRAMLRNTSSVPTPTPTPTPTQQPPQPQPQSRSWLPYLLVALVGVVVLGFALMSAIGGGGGGSGSSGSSTSAQDNRPAEGQDEDGPAEQEASYYLAVSDGMVAIFTNSSATPYEVSDVAVSDLGSTSASELDAHVPCSSLDEAQGLVSAYRSEAEATVAARKQQQEQQAQQELENEIKANPFTTDYTQASSVLPHDQYENYLHYDPELVADGDFATAWCENASGTGTGEWVSINCNSEKWTHGVRIVNGYPRRDDIYYRNCRCKEVRIDLSDGYSTQVTLDDLYNGWQAVDFGDYHKTSYIRLTIVSVYQGSEWEDTLVAEMQAY